ncbi:MAG: SDR family oxidoreductase [Bacilli bacterium]|nr:SDR family oxidoreductase [Bacilli bacterium]
MKVVLVTGASKGIGYYTALEFAKNGYNVAINYNADEIGAIELQKNIHKYGGKSLIIKADISNEEEVRNMITTTMNELGQINVLINNAGIAIDNDIFDKSKEEFLKVLETNLVGTFLVSKEALKNMESGTIINISSTDGIDTYNPISMDYCASKAGIILLTKTIALRFPNINVYAVAPNWVKTPSVLDMNPEYLQEELKRIGQKELIEPAVVAKEIYSLTNNTCPSGTILRIDNK